MRGWKGKMRGLEDERVGGREGGGLCVCKQELHEPEQLATPIV